MKNLAIIGCDGSVYDYLYEYTKKLPVRLKAIVDSEENACTFAGMYRVEKIFSSYLEMLDEVRPELVLLFPADEAKQYEITKACLAAGANVLCERPICHSVSEGEELIELQEKTGCFVMPRYNRRYMPIYNSAKHILSSTEFGKTYMYSSCFHTSPCANEEKFIANHISHHLDLARMLLGELELIHVRRVWEDGKRLGFNIVFESKNGALGNIQSNSFLCHDYPRERLEISGDCRQIVAENVRHLWYNQPKVYLVSSDEHSTDLHGAVDFLSIGGSKNLNMDNIQLNNYTFYGFEYMLKEFVSCAERKIKPQQDMADALKTFRLVQSLFDMRNN